MAGTLRQAGLDHFDEVATSHVADDTVPGLVAAVASGDAVHVCVRGSLALGGPPVRRDSLFRIASTTKPVTGVATMALVDEGVLALDEPVETWLPELAGRRVLRAMDGPLSDTVAADRPVTVRDLLTFTFGFGMAPEMFSAPAPWPVTVAASTLGLGTLGPPNPDAQPGPDEWMAALGTLPLMAQPGARWLYNTGAQVLGVLAARATGTGFPAVLHSRVFAPLGMTDTAFHASDTSRLATAYFPGPDGLVVWDAPDGQWSQPPRFPDGAAGLVSTVDDLLALATAMRNGGAPVLPAGAVAEMTRDQLRAEQRAGDNGAILGERSWGLCLAVTTDGPHAGSYGWDGGLGTSWHIDPVRDLIVIVLTQRLFEAAQTPPVHRDLQAAAYAALA